jgi:tRNA modification GTPase
MDTAGLRSTNDRIESLGIGMARKSLASADLIVWISDISQPWSAEDDQALRSTPEPLLIHNKSDLPAWDDARPPGFRISLLTDPNIDDVLVAIGQRLREQMPPENSLWVVCPWQRDALQQAAEHLRRNDRAAAQSTVLQPAVDTRPATVD